MIAPHALTPTPVLGLIALWSDRQPSEFPIDAPPCDAIGNSSADRVLAAVFQSLALEPSPLRRSLHLSKIAMLHTERLRGVLNAKPTRRDELRPWFEMILVLARWNRVLVSA